MQKTLFAKLGFLLLPLLALGCGKKSERGETCSDSDSCAGQMRCIERVCRDLEADKAEMWAKATIEVANSDINQIMQALKSYEADFHRYPTEAEGLAVLLRSECGHEPYIAKASTLRDPWGADYVYRQPSPDPDAVLDVGTKGPDGKSPSADDFGTSLLKSQFKAPEHPELAAFDECMNRPCLRKDSANWPPECLKLFQSGYRRLTERVARENAQQMQGR